jgi:transcriptional regulator with XRE-family HTH domain
VDRNHPSPEHYIREWRRHRGLTQAQLADAVGVDRSLLNKIERGRRPHGKPVLEAIAARLECEPTELVQRHPSHTSELETLYMSLSVDEQVRAMHLLKLAFVR